MGAFAPVSSWSWIPEDDLLLREAAEKGASLESLAKGAVQFSRRFTVQELENRWHSLLYDPIVSAEASIQMIELEHSSSTLSSKTNLHENSKDKNSFSRKRKVESVRNCYYAMRKRICNEPLGSTFIVGPGDDHYVENGVFVDRSSNEYGIQDPDFDFGSHFLLESGTGSDGATTETLDFTLDAFCIQLQNHMEENLDMDENNLQKDIPNTFEAGVLEAKPPPMFDQIKIEDGNICSEYGGQVFNSAVLDCCEPFHEFEIWSSITSISPPTLPVHEQNGENTYAITDDCDQNNRNTSDYDEKNQISCGGMQTHCAKDYFAELTNVLLNFTSEEEVLLTEGDGMGMIDKSYIDGLNSILMDSLNMDEIIPEPPLASAMSSDFPELSNGVICCSLSTEDPEIPCNEDFTGCKITNNGVETTMKGGDRSYEQSHISNQIIGSTVLSEGNLNHPIGDHGTLGENHNVESQWVAFRNMNFACKGPNHMNSGALHEEVASVEQAKDSAVNHLKNACSSKQELDAELKIQNGEALHAELGSIEKTMPDSVVKPLPSDEKELCLESDDEVPCFSDVEAMILDMDLCPEDQDLNSNRKVSTYQNEEAKRVIIRLEQAANACMQRAMEAHGAFAVLYGHHLRHFIRKAEVLLGRSTKDDNVDIDFGREGHANKISRRQAIIMMDPNGSFLLKNLGRSSIFVNGKEVSPKQSLTITSNCLIEVKEMAFIFETNRARVKQYVDSMTQECQTQ